MRRDLALPQDADAALLARELNRAHDRFVSTGTADATMRALVVESWRRSLALGVDPERSVAPILLGDDELAEVREAHPLTGVMPLVRRLLTESATDAGLLVAVSDAAGRLLYVEGVTALRSRAEAMNFVPGAGWSEAVAGTNAPGTALAIDRPVQLLGPEHLSRSVTPWSCSAAPIHDPDTGDVLGVLDVTGGPEVARPQALSLVRATVAAAEAELRIARLLDGRARAGSARRAPPSRRLGSTRLEVLGRRSGLLHRGVSSTPLPLRGTELLLVLASSTEGLTAAELAVALSDDEQADVTIRVEVSRLRRVLAPLELTSRPYRLVEPLDIDLRRVRAALAEDRLPQALAAYVGPVLPRSLAPAVVRIRDDLHARLRAAVLGSADVETVLGFAEAPFGRDDYQVWTRARALLPDGSRRRQVEAHLARLDLELL